jgi:hypothetical protein
MTSCSYCRTTSRMSTWIALETCSLSSAEARGSSRLPPPRWLHAFVEMQSCGLSGPTCSRTNFHGFRTWTASSNELRAGSSNGSTGPFRRHLPQCGPLLRPPARCPCRRQVFGFGAMHPAQLWRASGSPEQTAFTSSLTTTRNTAWWSRTRCGRARAGNVPLYAWELAVGQIKAFDLRKISNLRVASSRFQPRYAIELGLGTVASIPPVSRSTQGPSKPSDWTGPGYVYECTICGRRFVHKKGDGTLQRHNDRQGTHVRVAAATSSRPCTRELRA